MVYGQDTSPGRWVELEALHPSTSRRPAITFLPEKNAIWTQALMLLLFSHVVNHLILFYEKIALRSFLDEVTPQLLHPGA